MIPHPSVWMDNPPTRKQDSMWKKILGWLFKFAPSIIEAAMEAKAKSDAEKPKA